MNHSAIDLDDQKHTLEAKLTTGFVNIAVALRAMLWQECLAVNISPIQGQILIFCQNHPPQLCRIGSLAKEFSLTKPTISDAVKTLERKGLLTKHNDPEDLRSFNLILTETGKETALQVAKFPDMLQHLLERVPDTRKAQLDLLLSQLTVQLKELGILSGQRSCVSCQHSIKHRTKKNYYCSFYQIKMGQAEVKLNCADFQAMPA
ncbi:MAG: MarR family winged helix-turn-helix transcriptional regulator [Haliscomenobacter sp.]|uniref:MarR family winged helix-turn-helix transcriptional regulator n=1 Tax=Haliscomenobacter sp. TaxID=2717303 RepID=UPI0029A3E73D|nr:MarR family winged helix-turn-helix transcriptional regulator [Haliscomenobacter sp.]MDX2068204.1 MarR family winged helix-turn-helix transcriptional regulator [Haliscomenobacter sp.]